MNEYDKLLNDSSYVCPTCMSDELFYLCNVYWCSECGTVITENDVLVPTCSIQDDEITEDDIPENAITYEVDSDGNIRLMGVVIEPKRSKNNCRIEIIRAVPDRELNEGLADVKFVRITKDWGDFSKYLDGDNK